MTTKKELRDAIAKLDPKTETRARATVAELQSIYDELETKAKAKKSKPAGKAPAPRQPGAKARLRAMFEQKGQVTFAEIDALAAELGVQPSTVTTMLSDLKNPNYAGPDGPLNIAKETDAERYVVQK